MKHLAFSPAAEADIDGIWDYSAQTWGPDQADRYTDEIRDACLALAHDHKTGAPRRCAPRIPAALDRIACDLLPKSGRPTGCHPGPAQSHGCRPPSLTELAE